VNDARFVALTLLAIIFILAAIFGYYG